MSDEIYDELTSSERDRFNKVREQQLSQREPMDKYDDEICKNNPELYDKYLKPDKELAEKIEREINSQIKDGIFNGNIVILSLYFQPNLDKLKVVNGFIYADNAISLSLPQLQECGNIYADNAISLSLPQLQECGYIAANNVTSLSLPMLQTSGNIDANNVTSLSLPMLQKCGNIGANNTKKIKIPSHLVPNISAIPEDCEIIDPSSKEQLTDSTIYDLMRSFLLRS